MLEVISVITTLYHKNFHDKGSSIITQLVTSKCKLLDTTHVSYAAIKTRFGKSREKAKTKNLLYNNAML